MTVMKTSILTNIEEGVDDYESDSNGDWTGF